MKKSIMAGALLASAFLYCSAHAQMDGVTPPEPLQPLEFLPTDYPLQALLAAQEGTVGMTLTFNAQGKLTHVDIPESTGSVLLDSGAASVAIKRWKFNPAMRDGQPVEGSVHLRATWHLPLTPAYEFELQAGDIGRMRPDAVFVPPVALGPHGVSDFMYQRDLADKGYEGVVSLRYLVQEDGNVGKIELIKPSGHPPLDTIASGVASRWKFKPATLDGKPVSRWEYFELTFILNPEDVPARSTVCTPQPLLGVAMPAHADKTPGRVAQWLRIDATGIVDDILIRTDHGWMHTGPELVTALTSAMKFPSAANGDRKGVCWIQAELIPPAPEAKPN